LNQAVTSIQYLEDEDKLFVSCTRASHAEIDGNPKENSNSASSSCDEIVHYKASHVIVTLPPQLAATAIEYTPPLDSITFQSMLKTKTWMAHAMKVALIYSKPFWRTNGLSGMAMTYDTCDKNPVQQYHDASPQEADNGDAGITSRGALFGWVAEDDDVTAKFRDKFTGEERRAAVIAQTVRLFGPDAANPLQYEEMDWNRSRFTSITHQSMQSMPDSTKSLLQRSQSIYGSRHLQRPVKTMNDRLWWAGTEASTVNGGYLDGAIYIGRWVAQQIKAKR
jgi:monoamine oxidase